MKNIIKKSKRKNNIDKKEQLSIHAKWNLDSESYKNSNYKVKVGEGQCYKCANRIKGNILKCSKFDNIPKEILLNKNKCKSRIERTIYG